MGWEEGGLSLSIFTTKLGFIHLISNYPKLIITSSRNNTPTTRRSLRTPPRRRRKYHKKKLCLNDEFHSSGADLGTLETKMQLKCRMENRETRKVLTEINILHYLRCGCAYLWNNPTRRCIYISSPGFSNQIAAQSRRKLKDGLEA